MADEWYLGKGTVQVVVHIPGPDGCIVYQRRRALTPAVAQAVDMLLNHGDDGLPVEAGGHPLGENRPLGLPCEEMGHRG